MVEIEKKININIYKPLNFIIISIRMISNETICLVAIWKKRGEYNEKIFSRAKKFKLTLKKTQNSIITILCTQCYNTLK